MKYLALIFYGPDLKTETVDGKNVNDVFKEAIKVASERQGTMRLYKVNEKGELDLLSKWASRKGRIVEIWTKPK